jgi:hypothetical protein
VTKTSRDKSSLDNPERPGNAGPENLLPSIDRLLNAVSDLMKHEPNIDRQAFEHMRQLQVRIRFAISDSEKISDKKSALKPPAKWLDRADKNESPLDFVRREYADLFGRISRPDLKKLDKSLYAALSNWISKNGPLPPEIDIPTKKQVSDKKLEQAGIVRAPSRSKRVSEMAESDVEKLRLYDLARRRKK